MIGRSLKQYQLLEKLGEGGMGAVYKAHDTVLGRDVAIKILRPDKLQDEGLRTRFHREAKTASALNHPNIITIYEIGTDQGTDFIAMEFVEGRSLSSVLQDGPLSIPTAVAYAVQITDALVKAHGAGIVHRDLKPANLMITPDGLLKVLDFGLARLQPGAQEARRDSTAETANATMQGTILGTVAYMSPEQARGEEVDSRSDIFSFGIVLFEMLSGQTPFAGPTQMSLLHNLHFNPPGDLRSFRPDVPDRLQRILLRLLEKPVDRRYQTMEEVRQDLRGFLSNAPAPSWISAAPVATAAASTQTPRQVQKRWLVGGGVFAVLVGLAVFLAIRNGGPGGEKPSEQKSGDVTTVAQPATPYEGYVQARSYLDRFDRDRNPDRAIQILESVVEKDPAYAPAYAALAEAYRYRYKLSPDPQWLKLMQQNANRAVELNPDLSAAHIAMALPMMEDRKLAAEAEAQLLRAIELDPQNSSAYKWLGVAKVARGDSEGALESLNKAVKMDPRNWTALLEIGLMHYQKGNYSEAAAGWERARAVTPDNSRVLANLAGAYVMLDRYEDAASTLQRAIEIHPEGQHYANLGTLRFFQGRYADAASTLEKAVGLIPNRYKYWGNLGDAYRWAPGARGKAPAAYRRGIELAKEQLQTKPSDSDLRSTLALYFAKSGDTPAALMELAKLESERSKPNAVLFKMAVAYEVSGMRDKSLASLEASMRAGYPEREIRNDPELLSLREDVRYHRMVNALPQPAR